MYMYKVILARKPFIMWILLHLRESNFCDDFTITDETLSEMKYIYITSLYLQ